MVPGDICRFMPLAFEWHGSFGTSRTHNNFTPVNKEFYSQVRQGNVTIWNIKNQLKPTMGIVDDRDSINVSIVVKYDKNKYMSPSLYFYNPNRLTDMAYLYEYDGGILNDTGRVRLPADTFDILFTAYQSIGEVSTPPIVIKELVPLKQDTTLVMDLVEATEIIPIVGCDEEGEKFKPDYINYVSTPSDFHVDTLKKGNIMPDGIIERDIILKGWGVVYGENSSSHAMFNGYDSACVKAGQLGYFHINKLSDRYSLAASANILKNNGSRYFLRMRKKYDTDSALMNSKNDYVTKEETFYLSKLGKKSKKHLAGVNVFELQDGLGYSGKVRQRIDSEVDYCTDIEDLSPDSGVPVKLYICAPKESGNREDARDYAFNLVLCDTYDEQIGNYNNIYGETFYQNGDHTEYVDNGHIHGSNYHIMRVKGEGLVKEFLRVTLPFLPKKKSVQVNTETVHQWLLHYRLITMMII